MRVALLGCVMLVAGCGGQNLLAESCEDLGLTPGTPQFERCYKAKLARQRAGERGALDTIRSVDVIPSVVR